MTRTTPELDRLAAARPDTARHAAALTSESERQRLLTAIMADERPQRPRQRHHRWLMPQEAAAPSASRRHRQIAFAAVAVTVTAGAAAAAVTALPPAGQQASRQPVARLAAWTVSKLADSNITVTIRRLANPAGLQSTLRADGVPASVAFTSRQNPACHAYPGGTPRSTRRAYPGGIPGSIQRVGTPLLDSVFPGTYQPLNTAGPHLRPTPVSINTVFLVIDPSALPGNAAVKIAISRYKGRGPLTFSAQPAVVYASPQCTGS